MTVTFEIPGMRLPTQPVRSGRKGGWFVARALAKKQREATALMWRAKVGLRFPGEPPYLVTLTRVAPGSPDYSNVVSSFKHVQDEVAAKLGIDDGEEDRIEFVYRREKGDYAVRVSVMDCHDIGLLKQMIETARQLKKLAGDK